VFVNRKSSPIIHNTNGRQSISASAKDLLLVLAGVDISRVHMGGSQSRGDQNSFLPHGAEMENHIIPCVRRIYTLFSSKPTSQLARSSGSTSSFYYI